LTADVSRALQLRRSVLYVPGSNPRALEKAWHLPCDGIILDLEDAVAPEAKTSAREQVTAAAQTATQTDRTGRREVVIRINGIYTDWGENDLQAAARSGADAICVPKIDTAAQLAKVADLMMIAGAPDTQKIWVMAETPRCILSIDAIAGVEPRLEVIVMGTADLGKALRLPADPARTGLLPSLGQCILAARCHGLDILDGVHGDLADVSGFRGACEQGKGLGFDGKTLIHPGQIETANEVFGVSEEEVAQATRVIAAWEAAAEKGHGVAVLNGRMIEALHADEARRTLALHTAISDSKR
jgi:citrate lyase subunit beta/citryl-CoA lyase